jgi:GTPase SAR1 family protein
LERKLQENDSIADITTLSVEEEAQLLAAFAGHRTGSNATNLTSVPNLSASAEKPKKKKIAELGGPRKTTYVLMLGFSGVGRSSIMTRLTDDAFTETPLSTGTGTEVGYVDLDSGMSIQIISPHFTLAHSMEKYIQDAKYPISGVIYVVDAAEQKSHAEIVQWFSNMPEGLPLVIFGARSDLYTETHIPKIALIRNCKTYFVSAKTGSNLRMAFDTFITDISGAPESKGKKGGLLSAMMHDDPKDKKTPRTPRAEKDKDKDKDKKKKDDKDKDKASPDNDFFARLEAGYQKKK